MLAAFSENLRVWLMENIEPRPDDRKIVRTEETEYSFDSGLVHIDDINKEQVFMQ